MQQTNKWNDQTNNAVEVAIKWDIGPSDHPFRSSYGQMSSLAHWWPNNTFTPCKPTFENLSIRHLNPWFVACDHPQLIDGGRDCGRQQKAWNCESSVICQSSHLLPSPPNAYHQSEAWNNEPPEAELTNIPVFTKNLFGLALIFETPHPDLHLCWWFTELVKLNLLFYWPA